MFFLRIKQVLTFNYCFIDKWALHFRKETTPDRSDETAFVFKAKDLCFDDCIWEPQYGHASAQPPCANDKTFISRLFKRRQFSFRQGRVLLQPVTSMSEDISFHHLFTPRLLLRL